LRAGSAQVRKDWKGDSGVHSDLLHSERGCLIVRDSVSSDDIIIACFGEFGKRREAGARPPSCGIEWSL
jgi:hypothetical protein